MKELKQASMTIQNQVMPQTPNRLRQQMIQLNGVDIEELPEGDESSPKKSKENQNSLNNSKVSSKKSNGNKFSKGNLSKLDQANTTDAQKMF